ncbi:MAG TPA: threonine synthase [Candidatus Limnocylindrales bacterium]|nr:threonine synthase [Candidatus Limnocylindrales bacterium]
MAIEVLQAQPTTHPRSSTILGLRCRGCGRAEPIGLSYVCPACFGPLEVEYDYEAAGRTLTHASVAVRAPGIWRYAELLPVDSPPVRGLPVGSTPLTLADRLAPALGLERLWIKDDTRNPSLSFKDRAVAVAAARAVEFGVDALACASTGNLAGATAAAAAALGLAAYVFIPADLEPAKVDHALAYGATVVPIEGTYDDVNRLCLEVADETGWGFVNINLRPFYAEGSKTLAFEIAESLGWRSPDVVVAPVASGAMFTRVARGFEELVALGLIERRPIRFVGGQAAGCAPVATAWAAGTDVIEPVRAPGTIVRSLAIGNPADGRYVVELANESGGSVEAIDDPTTAAAIRDIARLEGIYPETAGGVTLAAAAAARRRGVIRPGDEVVALVTGNGLKTPDARTLGLEDGVARPGQPGLAPPIRPSLAAFERWLEGAAA